MGPNDLTQTKYPSGVTTTYGHHVSDADGGSADATLGDMSRYIDAAVRQEMNDRNITATGQEFDHIYAFGFSGAFSTNGFYKYWDSYFDGKRGPKIAPPIVSGSAGGTVGVLNQA